MERRSHHSLRSMGFVHFGYPACGWHSAVATQQFETAAKRQLAYLSQTWLEDRTCLMGIDQIRINAVLNRTVCLYQPCPTLPSLAHRVSTLSSPPRGWPVAVATPGLLSLWRRPRLMTIQTGQLLQHGSFIAHECTIRAHIQCIIEPDGISPAAQERDTNRDPSPHQRRPSTSRCHGSTLCPPHASAVTSCG